MIQEFEYLREIERSLYGGLGFIPERETDTTHSRVWCDLYGNNRYETDLDRFLASKIAEYRNTIAAMDQNDLRSQNGLRGKELLHFFQMVQKDRSQSCSPVSRKDERHFKKAFRVLTLGYIAATVWEYMTPNRGMDAYGFLDSFLSAGLGIEEVAKTVEELGITDAKAFCSSFEAQKKDRGSKVPASREYNLLANYPVAKVYLDRLVIAAFLNTDYSLKTTKATAAIIASTIAGELKISAFCKYFEKLWGIKDLSGALKQVKSRANKEQTRFVLQVILRKKVPGINADSEDSEKIEKYLRSL